MSSAITAAMKPARSWRRRRYRPTRVKLIAADLATARRGGAALWQRGAGLARAHRRAGQQRRHHGLRRRLRRFRRGLGQGLGRDAAGQRQGAGRSSARARCAITARSGGGTIITISSWNAQRGSTNPITIAYAASKAAVMAATKTIARAYAKEKHPGLYRRARRGAHAAVGEFCRHPGRRAGGDGEPRHGRVGAARRHRQAGGLPGDRPLPPSHRRHARRERRELCEDSRAAHRSRTAARRSR